MMSLLFKSSLFSLKPQIVSNRWNINVEEKRSSTLMKPRDLRTIDTDKLEVVKHELRNVGEHSVKGLYMIDAMQRLNIDYHFQEEIEAFLRRQYGNSTINNVCGCWGHDLHQTALRFRLLRQQGYFVPAEVFEKFTNKKERFNLKLGENINGMMELFEASQLSMAGEYLLDEAGEFSRQILNERVAYLDNDEAKFVRRTLEQPFHKSLPMFTSRNFFGHSQDTNRWLGSLKEVAKKDFSILQCLHHQEMLQISRWWTELGLVKELPYARNQPLKWYIWSLACLTDPTLSDERVELTKPISLIYIIDDIFDIYGTLDELTLFTQAVSKWDIRATEHLPDYMKTCFKVLYDLTNEISYKVYHKYGWDPTVSLQNVWKSLCKAFLVEAKWFASGKLPSGREYLRNGIVSSGVHIVLVHLFFLLGQGLTKENVEIIDTTTPPIISSPATILRLWDDLGNAEDENQEGNDGSYLSCLMMDHPDHCIKRAREEVMGKINEAWKSLNQECLFDTHFHKPFTKAALNLARMVPLMYGYDDNHSLPGLEDQVKSLLYDQLPS